MFVAMPTIAFAQESESGSIVDPVREAREYRVEGFRSGILQTRKARALFIRQAEDSWAKRTEHRRKCAEDLRRSNRDSRLSILLRCERGQLALSVELLRKRQQQLASLPGLSPTVREQGLSAQARLIDAIARQARSTSLHCIPIPIPIPHLYGVRR